MKKLGAVLAISGVMLVSLASCDLMDLIQGGATKNTLENYLISNYLNPNKTSEDLSNDVTTTFRTWKEDTGSYVSPNGTRVSISTNSTMIQTHSGNRFIINTMEGVDHAATYADPTNGDRVFLYWDNTRVFMETDGTPKNIYLNVYKKDDGYLFILDEPLALFITNDYKNIYLSEDGSKNFTFYGNKTYTLNDTTELDKLDKSKFYKMPDEVIPTFSEDTKIGYSLYGTYYKVFVPKVKPMDAIAALKESGFSLYQSDLYGFYAFDEQDVVYEGTDSDNTIAVKVSYEHSIEGVVDEPDLYGTSILVYDYRYRSAYYQIELNNHLNWTKNQQNTLNSIGADLPYTQFGDLLIVTSSKGGWDSHSVGRLELVDCYSIKDDYYKPLLGNYENLLIDAGFVKHVPTVTANSTPEEIEAWKTSADAVYYNCYISESQGIAVKFSWDILNGNIIYIYTLDDLKRVVDGTYEWED